MEQPFSSKKARKGQEFERVYERKQGKGVRRAKEIFAAEKLRDMGQDQNITRCRMFRPLPDNSDLWNNDPETGMIFSQPPVVSFKRDKKIGNSLVKSAFQTSDQTEPLKCVCARYKTNMCFH